MGGLKAQCRACRYSRSLTVTVNHKAVSEEKNIRPMKHRCGCVLKDLIVYESQAPCNAFVWGPQYMRVAKIAEGGNEL